MLVNILVNKGRMKLKGSLIALITSSTLLLVIGVQQSTIHASTVWHNETPTALCGSWKKTFMNKTFGSNGNLDGHVKSWEAYRITQKYVSYGAYGLDSYAYKVNKTVKIGTFYYVHGYEQLGSKKYYRTWKFKRISNNKILAPLLFGKGLGTYNHVHKVNI